VGWVKMIGIGWRKMAEPDPEIEKLVDLYWESFKAEMEAHREFSRRFRKAVFGAIRDGKRPNTKES